MTAWTLRQGDCRDVLLEMPEKHFHCCVTSPPYWGLRSYLAKGDPNKDREIGSEKTPQEYVAHMVEVARGVRRVLRDDGTFWLNVGDCYGMAGKNGGHSGNKNYRSLRGGIDRNSRAKHPAKSLCLIPERLALALQEDGWVIRSKVRWFKVSPMPESVRDRPTSAAEEIFLLTKQGDYFYDQEAERVDLVKGAAGSTFTEGKTGDVMGKRVSRSPREDNESGRNLWNWWEVVEEGSVSWFMSNEPLKEKHYAAFPSLLPTRCIRLGTSQKGCCSSCGAPLVRVLKKKKIKRKRPNDLTKRQREDGTGNATPNSVAGTSVRTLGWEPSCACPDAEPVPCRVLDPFAGAGTTLLAALRLHRESQGVELSDNYIQLARKRIVDDSPLFNTQAEALAS